MVNILYSRFIRYFSRALSSVSSQAPSQASSQKASKQPSSSQAASKQPQAASKQAASKQAASASQDDETQEQPQPLTKEHVNAYLSSVSIQSFSSFADYSNLVGKIWRTTLNRADFRKSTCSCPEFFKSYFCKHVIGVAAMENLVVIPNEAKVVRLGQKPKRGRRPLIRSALERQEKKVPSKSNKRKQPEKDASDDENLNPKCSKSRAIRKQIKKKSKKIGSELDNEESGDESTFLLAKSGAKRNKAQKKDKKPESDSEEDIPLSTLMLRRNRKDN